MSQTRVSGWRPRCHQAGWHRAVRAGREQHSQFRADRVRDGDILISQPVQRFDDQALQVQPGAAARHGHGSLGQLQQFTPFLSECEPLELLAQFGRRRLKQVASPSLAAARSSPNANPASSDKERGYRGSRLRRKAAALDTLSTASRRSTGRHLPLPSRPEPSPCGGFAACTLRRRAAAAAGGSGATTTGSGSISVLL